MSSLSFIITFAASLAVSTLLMPLILYVSRRYGWFDPTDHRKIHDGEIPRLGGVAIFLGWVVGAVVIPALLDYPTDQPGTLSAYRLAVFMLGAAAIHLTGLWDDFTNLRPRYKFLIQIVVAVVLVVSGIRFYRLALPFTSLVINFPPLSIVLSVFWLVGVSNAVNLIDGMDGLSSTVSLAASLAFGFMALALGRPVSALVCFALSGAIIGFLFFNKPPARIFMGDSGALFLGYVLAALPLLEGARQTPLAFGIAATVMLIPITDTLFAMGRRIIRRIPIAKPDREHLHHMLLDFGLSEWAILALVGGYGIALAALAVLFSQDFWAPGVALGLMVFLWLFTFALIGAIHRKWKRRSLRQEPDPSSAETV
jgi:UDP-GlcNAc:undecaprenyl-phosphate/decaprenyl-phosphate GlcNAc-1-phosphate transferase